MTLLGHIEEESGIPRQLLDTRLAIDRGIEGALEESDGERALIEDLLGPLPPLHLEF
jgi:hypothetical protein